jgi:hypothetical protein
MHCANLAEQEVLVIVQTAAMVAMAGPLRLVVRPHGTNQLELAASPPQNDALYLVLARTNRPTGHWIGLTSIIGGSNATVTILYPRGRGRLAVAREPLVQRLKNNGVGQHEIARRIGVNEKTIRKFLRRLGWLRRCLVPPI